VERGDPGATGRASGAPVELSLGQITEFEVAA
jgi:hypothetical protein